MNHRPDFYLKLSPSSGGGANILFTQALLVIEFKNLDFMILLPII